MAHRAADEAKRRLASGSGVSMESGASEKRSFSPVNGSTGVGASASEVPVVRQADRSVSDVGDEMVSGFVLVERVQRLRRIVIGVVAGACGLIVVAVVLQAIRHSDERSSVPAALHMSDTLQENRPPTEVAAEANDTTTSGEPTAASDTLGSSAKSSIAKPKSRRPKASAPEKQRAPERLH